MMVKSHNTEFHTHKHEEPVTTELLNKVTNVLEVCDAQRQQKDNGESKQYQHYGNE